MRELSSAEIHALIAELRPKIENGYIRKFYEVGQGSFRFSFYNSASKNTMVFCKLLSTFNETRLSESVGEPSPFTMGMRKRIENTRVIGITQPGTDRIIILGIEAHGEKYKLILEMFGKGNVILVNQSGTTEICYRRVVYKDRRVEARAAYSFPNSDALDIWGASRDDILGAVNSIVGKPKAMAELSKRINTGPLYLEDVFKRSGIDPKGRLDGKDAARLAEGISGFLEEMISPKPVLYKRDGVVVDYAILPIKKYEDQNLERTEFESISGMLDEIHSEERSTITDEAGARRLAELTANVKKQEELAEQLKREADEYQKAGHRIFERMDEINALISYLQNNKRATLEEARAAFKGLRVKELDLKNKLVKIELEI